MILGRTAIGATPTTLALDTRHTSVVAPLRDELLSKVTVYLDGQGGGVGDQWARAVIYDAAGDLFAESAPLRILDDRAPGWVDFSFIGTAYLAKPMPVQAYQVGLHVGLATNVIRVYGEGSSASAQVIDDTYADGAALTVGAGANAGLLSAFVTGSAAWDYPADAIDSIFARYGWEDSQLKLGESGALEDEGVSGSCGWHGTLLDPELGAFAVVREDGPMAAFVGERLQVVDETSGRSCYVYCHTDGPVIEDVSLTRRAFQALSLTADDELEVTAMPLGPVVSLG